MANINLLPEDMRKMDKKEILKAAKKPKTFTIDLSAGKNSLPRSSVQPSNQHSSLWSKVFGQPAKPTSQIGPILFGSRPEVTPTKPQTVYQSLTPKAVVKPKTSFLSSIGPAQSPVRSSRQDIVVLREPSFELENKSKSLKVDYNFETSHKNQDRGFFSSLMKLFTAKSVTAKSPKISKVIIESQKIIEPKSPASEKSPAKYHHAPKAEKSKLNINLIPEELLFRKYPKSRQQIFTMVLAIIIPTLLITAGYVLIDQQQKATEAKIVALRNDKTKLITYINSFKDIQAKNIRLQDKLLAINKLLQKHVYWTKFFSLLERYTLDDVYYTEFSADTSGKFMLPAIAVMGSGSTVEDQIADSYRKAAEQIKAFQKAPDFITQTKVNNLEVVTGDNAGIKGVKFEINLSLAEGVFINNEDK